MEQKTPLYQTHVALNAKMVPFAGFSMPIQYKESGVIKEHQAVRNYAGLFDVSHMGTLKLSGKGALETLQKIGTNDFASMKSGDVRYTLMCQENGGVLDDFIVYCYEDHYRLIINASNRESDEQWIREHLEADSVLESLSDETAILALQGPKSHDILSQLLSSEDLPSKKFKFTMVETSEYGIFTVSTTGYTGEDGYELYCSSDVVVRLWTDLLAVGKEKGLLPCGLGARDTLRLEAGLPLYGHELTPERPATEANVDFAIKMKKESFIGKEALVESLPINQTRVGLKVIGRGIVREGAVLTQDKKEVGVVTSGTHSPTLGYSIAMATVLCDVADVGTRFMASVRGREIEVEVVALPFV